jgi:tetratricopeptide (TPR) repeat protein
MHIKVILLGGMLFFGGILPSPIFAGETPDEDEVLDQENSDARELKRGIRPVRAEQQDTLEAHLVNSCITMALNGDLDRALEGFLELLDKNYDEPLLLSNVAAVYAAQGETELALLLLGNALNLDPDFRLAEANLKSLLSQYRQGDPSVSS